MTLIHTARGRFPLWLMRVVTQKVVYEWSGSVDWITSYRLLGFITLRQDVRKADPTIATSIGTLPAREIELQIKHGATPCGTAIATAYFYQGECVKCDIRQEVYRFDSVKGAVTWKKNQD